MIKIFRHIVQILAVVLLIMPVYFTGVIWYGTYISSDLLGISLTDPLTALEIILAGKDLWVPLVVSAIPLSLLAVVCGRVFCSYVCPMNLLLEVLPAKKAAINEKRLPIFALLVVLVASLIVSVPVFVTVSPVFALMRMIVFGIGAEVLLVALVVIAAFVWGQKSWCQSLCPLGAIYGVLGVKRRLAVVADMDKCVKCGKCTAVCSMGTSPLRKDFAGTFSCTNCGDCIGACEQGAVHYTAKGTQ